MREHLDVLKTSDVGKFLFEFREAHKVKLKENAQLPPETEARYIHDYGLLRRRWIEYGRHVHAALLGHEIRHAWQHIEGIQDRVRPTSVEEYVMLQRAIEADARANEFGVTVQVAARLLVDNEYASHMVACLDEFQKRILEYKVSKLEEVGSSPTPLKQAMRQVFDNWIGMSSGELAYDSKIEAQIRHRQNISLSKLFRTVASGRMPRLTYFLSTGVRPDFMQNVASALGIIGNDRNYLTQSDGLDFTDPFYTKICNYRLEELADPIRQKIGQPPLFSCHI